MPLDFKTCSTDSAIRSASTTSRSGLVPKGYCFNFHRKSFVCRKGRFCTFRHNCPRWRVFHPAYLECGLQTQALSSDSAANKRARASRGSTRTSPNYIDTQFFCQKRPGLFNQAGNLNQTATKLSK